MNENSKLYCQKWSLIKLIYISKEVVVAQVPIKILITK